MANQKAAEQETLGSAMNKTELFLEKNAKTLSVVLLGLIILGALIFGYRALIVTPRVEKAADMLAQAQYRLEGMAPDYALALNGDENGPGFLDVVEQYGSTPAGNLARHYAGICYLKLDDLDNAATYLEKFKAVKGLPGAMVNAQNYGLQGDIAVQQGDYARAVNLFDKAVAAADNNLTAPYFLRKAGLAAEAADNHEQAIVYYQRILDEYPGSFVAREAEKLLGAASQAN